jgi:hypothetical protein
VNYKKLGLRIQFDAVQGLKYSTQTGVQDKVLAMVKKLKKNKPAVYPRGYINNFYASVEQWRIDDGSFVKLREISLSYVFGNFKMIRDITLSVSGRNLISWDDYKGYDPGSKFRRTEHYSPWY